MIFFISIFLFLVLLECFAYYIVLGGKFVTSPPSVKYEGAQKGIEKYFIQTISWITIVVGLISLEKNNLDILFFLFLSLIFFIFSFRIGWISGTKRIFFFIQQRLFNYSMIIAYYGLVILLFTKGLYDLGFLSVLGLVILYLFELYELRGDLKIGLELKKNMSERQKDDRICRIQDITGNQGIKNTSLLI